MRKNVIFCSVVVLQAYFLAAQYVVKDVVDLANLKGLPQEKVYVNHTGPLVFTGEYLYYGFHCFNAQNNRPSEISKVGYVALVNEEREFVMEQKFKLDKGLGQGDFFVSTDLPSGKYKLLGYTQWMKNNGIQQVFKDDIVVINPYMADQSALLENGNGKSPSFRQQPFPEDSATVGFQFEKKEFGQREEVSFSLKNYKGYLGNGHYTVKVVKKPTVKASAFLRANQFAQAYLNVPKQIGQSVGDSLFLPEQRGELLFGSVKDKTTGNPVGEVLVVISLPGKEFLLKFSTTDQNGNFYTYLRKDYKNATAVVQVEDETDELEIQIREPRKLDVSGLQFDDFVLDESFQEAIVKRSVYNQIENQFFTTKPDSVLLGDPIDPFDGGIPEVFNLDDYTRFKTFQETLVEILNNAGYRNNGKDNDYIRIAQDFETFNEEFNSFPAIVLIDGVYIPNHEAIKEYDAGKIKTISLIRDQFQLANTQYQGIMSVETFEGNYMEEHQHSNSTIQVINKPFPKKNYYRQQYGANEAYQRIPDYRTLLFWEPNIVVDGNSYDFEFYTSDMKGEFEVLLDGFTNYGKPISITQVIHVK